MKELPAIPSELLTVALNDLEACEKDTDYWIDMDIWHFPNEYTKRCKVCLAGAVMAKSLGVSKEEALVPDIWKFKEEFSKDIDRKLMAINYFRTGLIREGLRSMGIPEERQKSFDLCTSIEGYVYNPNQFKKDIRNLIKWLKKNDL